MSLFAFGMSEYTARGVWIYFAILNELYIRCNPIQDTHDDPRVTGSKSAG